jgi:hypothetical protein
MTAVTERYLQCMLLVACVLVLILDLATPVSCQGGCVPPLVTPGYMDPITITNGSWTPTTSVTVKIDERYLLWGSTVVNRIQAGEVKWNSPLTCSGVSFNDFETVVFNQDDYANPPPFHHHYWFVAVPAPNPDGSPRNGETQSFTGSGGRVGGAITRIHPNIAFNPQSSDPSLFNYFGSHETGHTFNLKDCLSTTSPACATGHLNIMSGNGSTAFNETGPNACDFNAVAKIYCPSTPTPTPTPTPDWPWPDPYPPTDPETCENGGWYWNFSNSTCNPDPADATCGSTHCAPYVIPLDGGDCNSADDYCAFPYGCPPGTVDGGRGCCCFPTPVLIDVSGNGFSLTDAYNGVMFDMGGDGKKEPVAWTTADNDDAWLVLDRNGNGQIDSAKEMFGNFTDQPHATTRLNGFVALAEFDLPENGGNGDGLIQKNDAVFSSLLLWQDVNQNGVSERAELHTLKQLGFKTIELDFKESKRTDQYGNEFKYRAKVKDNNDAQMGRWAWDVILKANPPMRR